MAIYYVDTAADPGGNGTTSATTGANCAWDTIADVNAASFNAGDSVLFKKGCTWREQLTIPSSGSAGSLITFGSYGTGDNPIINGSNIIGTWTQHEGDIWQATVTTQPLRVFFNGTLGTLVANHDACDSANDWFWAANVLYVYSTSDPDSAYTNPGIESGARQYCIYASAKDYITVDEVDITKAGAIAISATGIWITNSDHWIIQNLTVSDCNWNGIVLYTGSCDNLVYNVTVTGTATSANGGSSIGAWKGGSDRNEISHCTAYGNWAGIGSHGEEGTPDGPDATWIHDCICYDNTLHGIFITLSTNTIVEHNECYGNDGNGIRDSSGDLTSIFNDGNIYRYNKAHDNTADGIYFIYSQNFTCNYNLSYANGESGIQINHFVGGEVYNNTLYNNAAVPLYLTSGDGADVVIKNNIIDTCSGDSVGIYALDNAASNFTSDYNCVNETYFGRIQTGGNYSLADWRTATGQDANSMLADPLFVSTVTPDLSLQSISPCINTGVDVGLTEDYAGTVVPQGATPDMGAYEYYIDTVLKRWSGASWVKGKTIVYLDGSWQARPIKRWTGAEWIEVDGLGS